MFVANASPLVGGDRFEGERLVRDSLGHGVATHALSADAHDFRTAVGKSNANILKIRFEIALRNTGDFRTDALQMLGATARRNVITNDLAFSANFANSRHNNSYFIPLGEPPLVDESNSPRTL